MRDSILGCLVGGAIGDAAGSAYESGAPASSAPEWRITDDTQLTLATCEAVIAGGVGPETIAYHLLKCFRNGRITGIGSSTLKALRDLDAGCHWALAGCKGERAAGNGAAMRIAPLAFCTDPATPAGRQLIRDVCRITHHHEEAYVGGLAVVLAIRLSLSPVGTGPFLGTVANELPDSVLRDRLTSLASSQTIAQAAEGCGTSGYVAESVPLALFASQQVLRLGFAETVAQIIQVGGDTDTIASIAGQVAGAAVGFAGLPAQMMERLSEREALLDVANRFAEAILAT